MATDEWRWPFKAYWIDVAWGAFAVANLVAMVTCNPAKLLKWEDKVGSIAPGMVADLVVIDDMKAKDPYRNLIEATEARTHSDLGPD